MRVKYGYRNFAAKVFPLATPKRPFDKTKDFKCGMDLFVYLTPTGLVSKTKRGLTSAVVFDGYRDGFAYIFVLEIFRWKLVNPNNVHVKED